MTQDAVVDVVQQAVWTIIVVAGPTLILALTVGVLVSVFQTITSIQEPTLAFVPKILAVLLSLLIFGYYMLTTLTDFVYNLFGTIPDYLLNR